MAIGINATTCPALLNFVRANPVTEVTCNYLHPGYGCLEHAIGYWLKGFRLGLKVCSVLQPSPRCRRSPHLLTQRIATTWPTLSHIHTLACARTYIMQLYIPLSLVMFLFARQKRLGILVANLLRSCCFLASYCTLAICPSCIFYRFTPGLSRTKLVAHTWAAGLAVLFERPSYEPLPPPNASLWY
jgi:hypothetical protein